MATYTIGSGKTYSSIAAFHDAAGVVDGDIGQVFLSTTYGGGYYYNESKSYWSKALTYQSQVALQQIHWCGSGNSHIMGSSALNTASDISGTMEVNGFTLAFDSNSFVVAGKSGTIRLKNCYIIGSNVVSSYDLSGSTGVTHEFVNCVFANCLGSTTSQADYSGSTTKYANVTAKFYNCAFYGARGAIKCPASGKPTIEMINCWSSAKQTATDSNEFSAVTFNANTDYNIVAGATSVGAHSQNNVAVSSMNFVNFPRSFDIDTSSVAYHAGTPITGITTDMWGRSRNGSTPSIGPFEGGVLNPAITDVRKDIQWWRTNTSYTGSAYIPTAANTRFGVNVDATTGLAYIPTAADTRFGVDVDQTVGELVVPAVGDVAFGIAVDDTTGTRIDCPTSKAFENATYGDPLDPIVGTVELSSVLDSAGGTLDSDYVLTTVGGNWHKADKAFQLVGHDFGINGTSEVASYVAASGYGGETLSDIFSILSGSLVTETVIIAKPTEFPAEGTQRANQIIALINSRGLYGDVTRKTTTVNSSGVKVETWTAIASKKMWMQGVSSAEQIELAKRNITATNKIYTAEDLGVSSGDRITYNSVLYRVASKSVNQAGLAELFITLVEEIQ